MNIRRKKRIDFNSNNVSIGYLIIIGAFIVFIIRSINIVNSYNKELSEIVENNAKIRQLKMEGF